MEVRSFQHKDFVPSQFLTVFTRESGHERDTYLEIGEIIREGKNFRIGPSIPADMEVLNDLVASIKTSNFKALKFKALTPLNVLYHHSVDDKPTILWEQKAGNHHLHFSESIGMESGNYHMPRMLFYVDGGSLSVFRLEDGDDPITEDTKLFMMPLPNIYNNSQVCIGNGGRKLKKPKTLDDYMANAEALFYNTRFNALHHKKFGEGIVIVEQMKTFNVNSFPLVPADPLTLKKLINATT